MGKKKYKRRQYIVDSRFQYRLISKFAILTASIVIGSLSFLVLAYYRYGDVQISVEQPILFGLADSFMDNETVKHIYPFESFVAGTINLPFRNNNFYFFLQCNYFSQNGGACFPDAKASGRDGTGRPEESGEPPEKKR